MFKWKPHTLGGSPQPFPIDGVWSSVRGSGHFCPVPCYSRAIFALQLPLDQECNLWFFVLHPPFHSIRLHCGIKTLWWKITQSSPIHVKQRCQGRWGGTLYNWETVKTTQNALFQNCIISWLPKRLFGKLYGVRKYVWRVSLMKCLQHEA